jgi:hypothetical protein
MIIGFVGFYREDLVNTWVRTHASAIVGFPFEILSKLTATHGVKTESPFLLFGLDLVCSLSFPSLLLPERN